MSDDEVLRNQRNVFVVGISIGIGIGTVGLYLLLQHGIGTGLFLSGSSPPSNQAAGNAPGGTTVTKPEHWLRLIQAIGILLPLFTGLLRLTTNDQSDVSGDLDTELLFGVTVLVLGGIVAVGGLIAMNTPVVLKLALFFVLLTFGTIGFAAVRIFTETTSRREVAESVLSRVLSALVETSRQVEELVGLASDSGPPEGGTDSGNQSGDRGTTTTDGDTNDE